MKTDKAVITFKTEPDGIETDLEIPLDISAYWLLAALDEAYALGTDFSDMRKCFLTSERPAALLKGTRLLKDCGICSGSIIYYRSR